MRRNVAGQKIAFQMVLRADGTDADTGTPVVDVTKDGAITVPGTGAIDNRANGLWIYTPTQPETDAAHVAFTMRLTDAVTQTVQVYTDMALRTDFSTVEAQTAPQAIADAIAQNVPNAPIAGSTHGRADDAATQATTAALQATIAANQTTQQELANAQSGTAPNTGPVAGTTHQKLDTIEASITGSTVPPRINRKIDQVFKIGRRADGTVWVPQMLNIKIKQDGNYETPDFALDCSDLYGDTFVKLVGTPVVDPGGLTCAAEGPRDTMAVLSLGGMPDVPTGPSQYKISVPITLDTDGNETIEPTIFVNIVSEPQIR